METRAHNVRHGLNTSLKKPLFLRDAQIQSAVFKDTVLCFERHAAKLAVHLARIVIQVVMHRRHRAQRNQAAVCIILRYEGNRLRLHFLSVASLVALILTSLEFPHAPVLPQLQERNHDGHGEGNHGANYAYPI